MPSYGIPGLHPPITLPAVATLLLGTCPSTGTRTPSGRRLCPVEFPLANSIWTLIACGAGVTADVESQVVCQFAPSKNENSTELTPLKSGCSARSGYVDANRLRVTARTRSLPTGWEVLAESFNK